MRNSIPVVSLTLALTASSLAACAGTPSVSPRNQIVLSVGDLDMASDAGAKDALRRIQQAANKACGGQPTFSSFTGRLDDTFHDCREAAVSRAIAQLNAPRLALLYQDMHARNGSP